MDHQLCSPSPNSSQFYTIYFDQVGPLDFDYHAVFHGQKDLADEMEMTKLASNYFSDIGVTMPIHFDSSFIRWFFEVESPCIKNETIPKKILLDSISADNYQSLSHVGFQIWIWIILACVYFCQWIYVRYFESYFQRFQTIIKTCQKICSLCLCIVKCDTHSIFYEFLLN